MLMKAQQIRFAGKMLRMQQFDNALKREGPSSG